MLGGPGGVSWGRFGLCASSHCCPCCRRAACSRPLQRRQGSPAPLDIGLKKIKIKTKNYSCPALSSKFSTQIFCKPASVYLAVLVSSQAVPPCCWQMNCSHSQGGSSGEIYRPLLWVSVWDAQLSHLRLTITVTLQKSLLDPFFFLSIPSLPAGVLPVPLLWGWGFCHPVPLVRTPSPRAQAKSIPRLLKPGWFTL